MPPKFTGGNTPAAPAPSGNLQVYSVCASTFGGTGGSCGTNRNGSFAELSINYTPATPDSQLDYSGLGNLPCGTQLGIVYGGGGKSKAITGTKTDTGRGGVGCGGHPRRVDLYTDTAKALGFSGLGVVQIARLDGQPIPVLGKPAGFWAKWPPPGVGLDPGQAQGDIGNVTGITQAANAIGSFFDWTKYLAWLLDPKHLLQLGEIILGGLILLMALHEMSRSPGAASVPTKIARKVNPL